MKTHRSILFLSFFAGVVSLFFVIILSNNTKGFQIALAFIGSSFISFLLEFPNFISIKTNNFNMLYYTLQDIKTNSSFLIMDIHNLHENDIVTNKFFYNYIQKIESSANNLRLFDCNYYLLRKNNITMLNTINSICSAFNNVKAASLKYNVNYCTLNLDNAVNNQTRSITSSEMVNDLICIRDNAEYLINLINTQAKYTFTKTTYKRWINDDAFLNNSNNNIKITQK